MIIEDDLDIAQAIMHYLKNENFSCIIMDNATTALSYLRLNVVDLILLDINLPDYDGFEVCKEIRKTSPVPVLVVTAQNEIENKVKALNLGADDYLVKPIDMHELLARMWTVLRRSGKINTNVENIKRTLKYDKNFKHFSINNKIIDLTPIEYKILFFLYVNNKTTLSKESIKKEAGIESSSRSLDFHIKNIKQKLKDDIKDTQFIKTIYGQGVRLEL